MADVTVTVTKTFQYRGQTARRGAKLNMAPIDAALECQRGYVTAEIGARIDPEPVPVPSRRRYRRRDLTAQD